MIQDTEKGNRTLMSGLTISPTAPSDATDYVCVAENVVDTDEMTSSLTIHGKFTSFSMHYSDFCLLMHTLCC